MRVCPFCATENEAFFRFCLGCGADLDEALGGTVESEAVPASMPQPAPQPVLKPKPAMPTPAAGSGVIQPRQAGPSVVASQKPAAPRGPEVRAKTADVGSKAMAPQAKAVASANAEAAAVRRAVPAATPGPSNEPPVPGTLKPLRKAEPSLRQPTEGGPYTGAGAASLRTEAAAAPALRVTESAPAPRQAAEVPSKRAVEVAATPKKGPAPKVRARLVMILEDGSDGQTIDVVGETVTIGREGSDITFPQDDFLASRHAELVSQKGGGLVLRPLESTNGVFLQVHEETELVSSDVFRIGQQLLSFEILSEVAGDRGIDPRGGAERLGSPIPEGAWGRLGQIIAPGLLGSVYLLGGNEVYLGRERGDITFPGDGFVSGLHALVAARGGRYFLKDLGSSNGTYLRLTEEASIQAGALVLAGQQLFRIEI